MVDMHMPGTKVIGASERFAPAYSGRGVPMESIGQWWGVVIDCPDPDGLATKRCWDSAGSRTRVIG